MLSVIKKVIAMKSVDATSKIAAMNVSVAPLLMLLYFNAALVKAPMEKHALHQEVINGIRFLRIWTRITIKVNKPE